MFKRIMVGIDENSAPGKVLSTALELARLFNARLAICYALDETILAKRRGEIMLANTISDVEHQLRSGARVFLDEAVGIAHAAGVDCETRLVESEAKQVAEMLADAAKEWQADLLVAGTHGQRGFERFFVGSVGEKLARMAGTAAGTSLLLVRSE